MTFANPRLVYSLWLMPSGGAEHMLADAIYSLSHEFSPPLFPPHITLIGELTGSEEELTRRTQEVARQIAPFSVELTTPAYLDVYFRALYMQVKKTGPIMRSNEIARQAFGRENSEPYMPHLSLLYGNFPTKAKESIIERLGLRLSVSFPVHRIHLYSTYGETSTWEELGVFPLNQTGE